VNDDPTDLKANEAQARARTSKAEAVALMKASDWKWLMSQPRGRRLVWRLLEETGQHRSSFTGNSETFFREGERNVGLKITAILGQHCVEDYAKMLVEQRDYE
jgi:hypothetical protein